MERWSSSRARSTTLMPFGLVTRIPKPVGPGCGKTFIPSCTSSTGQPGRTGVLYECHVPQASETTPGSTAAEPTDAA